MRQHAEEFAEAFPTRNRPPRNAFFAALTAVEYMAQAGEAVGAPWGALPELVAQVRMYKADVYTAAERLRGWRA